MSNLSTIILSPKSERKKSFREEAWDTVRFIIIALAIVVPIRMFVAQPFFVSGASMDPTFADGQYLIVDEISYRLNEPKRGDVVIFRYPKAPAQYFIKRVVGLPGETIFIKEQGQVFIKNNTEKALLAIKEPYVVFPRPDQIERVLEPDEYFVMGDNRAGSFDSRAWGPVKRDLIIGKAFLRLFPLSGAEIFPGQFRQTP